MNLSTTIFKLSTIIKIVVAMVICIMAVSYIWIRYQYPTGNRYYVASNGDDSNDGSIEHPFRTIEKINSISLEPNDIVQLKGGDTFDGPLLIDSIGSVESRGLIIFKSYGDRNAVITGGNGPGIVVNQGTTITFSHINVAGNGRKDGNISNGIEIVNGRVVIIDNLVVSGFQKSGISVKNSSGVNITNVVARDNGYAGISVEGKDNKKSCSNIYIRDSRVENNAGDPTNLVNHSGNGIVVSFCTNVEITGCVATNNGWDMPRVGNGPVGIWAYEADSVLISNCISFRNKTSKGGDDGGGFDIDGGVTNSILEYCLSWENEGSGIGLFQYNYASPWNNNMIRNNISLNDGLVSAAHAGIYVWNASEVPRDMTNASVYNNLIYNQPGSAIRYSPLSEHSSFYFYNNAFVTGKVPVSGDSGEDYFFLNYFQSIVR